MAARLGSCSGEELSRKFLLTEQLLVPEEILISVYQSSRGITFQWFKEQNSMTDVSVT